MNLSASSSGGNISVIIPYFNARASINRAIASVLKQTLSPLEILVVDDASEVPILPSDLASSGLIRVIRLDTNGGGSVARNAGIDEARGDWVAFLDSDDEWDSDKLRRQMEVVSCERDVGRSLFTCGVIIKENGVEVARSGAPLEIRSPMEAVLVDGAFLQTSTYLLLRRKAAEIRFNPELRKHQDWDFLHRWHMKGNQVVHQHDHLSTYHRGGSQQISRSRKPDVSRAWFSQIKAQLTPRAQAKFYLSEVFPFEFSVKPLASLAYLWRLKREGNLSSKEIFGMLPYALKIASRVL
jgi:glycosyltransferase involved in cell wall biosynthesis